jgi:hypothetical protein
MSDVPLNYSNLCDLPTWQGSKCVTSDKSEVHIGQKSVLLRPPGIPKEAFENASFSQTGTDYSSRDTHETSRNISSSRTGADYRLL